MKEYRVVVPKQHFYVVTFDQDDMPAVAVINGGLVGFEPKVVFGWHLSLMLDFEDLIENGMPSVAERAIVDPWEDVLTEAVHGSEPDKPNALFLARITWNETRELIYRIYEPEPVHRYLQGLIETGDHPRPFDYRIDPDPEWELAKWHLETALSSEKSD